MNTNMPTLHPRRTYWAGRYYSLTGQKAQNLRQLDEAGFNVPPAIILDATQVQRIINSDAEELYRLSTAPLGFYTDWPKLIVRSSGFVSMPGILHSETGIDANPAAAQKAIIAVAKSWDAPRAVAYRSRYGIDQDFAMGVIVQQYITPMLREHVSGTMLTRNPDTGIAEVIADLIAGDGTELMAGRASGTPLPYGPLRGQLNMLSAEIEQLFRCPQEVEFVHDGIKLWVVQSRPMRHLSEPARQRIVHEFFGCGWMDEKEAAAYLGTASNSKWHLQLLPTEAKPLAVGVGSVTGAVTGKLAIGRDFGPGRIFVAEHTEVDDAEDMLKCDGILTAVGSRTCHASMLARTAGIPAVVNAGFLMGKHNSIKVRQGDHWVTVANGTTVTIDGATGAIYYGKQPIKNLFADEHPKNPAAG